MWEFFPNGPMGPWDIICFPQMLTPRAAMRPRHSIDIGGPAMQKPQLFQIVATAF